MKQPASAITTVTDLILRHESLTAQLAQWDKDRSAAQARLETNIRDGDQNDAKVVSGITSDRTKIEMLTAKMEQTTKTVAEVEASLNVALEALGLEFEHDLRDVRVEGAARLHEALTPLITDSAFRANLIERHGAVDRMDSVSVYIGWVGLFDRFNRTSAMERGQIIVHAKHVVKNLIGVS